MKVIKPFFLGVLVSFGLALVLLVGLFFTPLREDLFFRLDPEMADIRSKLDRYQEWLAQTDLRIAGQESAAGGNANAAHSADSLRNAQTKAWRDYKGWRNRLGELARTQARPTADGFWPWTYSLRFWILPIGAALAFLSGCLFAFMARPLTGGSHFRSGKGTSPKGRVKLPKSWAQSPDGQGTEVQARDQALANFEEVIKKVARISESDRGNEGPIPPSRKPADSVEPPTAHFVPPTDSIPASAYTETPEAGKTPGPAAKGKEPETVPIPLIVPEAGKPAADTGRETRFMQIGPGWGESLDLPGERIGTPGPAPKSPLSMEDEDVADARKAAAKPGPAPGEGGGDPPAGFMPPTTEVERVERRKDEVLKLARKGMTSSEISRRLRISQDQVEFIIRLRREKG